MRHFKINRVPFFLKTHSVSFILLIYFYNILERRGGTVVFVLYKIKFTPSASEGLAQEHVAG